MPDDNTKPGDHSDNTERFRIVIVLQQMDLWRLHSFSSPCLVSLPHTTAYLEGGGHTGSLLRFLSPSKSASIPALVEGQRSECNRYQRLSDFDIGCAGREYPGVRLEFRHILEGREMGGF